MLLAAVLVLVLLAPPAVASQRWTWPVRGEVITPFVMGASRFAPGQHRGIDIAAAAGAPVRAACPGTVRFAGRVPGRARGVTVLCGPLVATHLELGRTTVRRGDAVGAGDIVGTVAASHVQLGARRLGREHGYIDPLALLGPDRPPPLGPVPPPRRPGPRLPAPAPAPVPVPPPASAPAPEPAPVPLTAWAGLAALLAGLPAGAVACRRRRRAIEATVAARAR